jgi:hypothetical protein
MNFIYFLDNYIPNDNINNIEDNNLAIKKYEKKNFRQESNNFSLSGRLIDKRY